jgi:hypothetical protein
MQLRIQIHINCSPMWHNTKCLFILNSRSSRLTRKDWYSGVVATETIRTKASTRYRVDQRSLNPQCQLNHNPVIVTRIYLRCPCNIQRNITPIRIMSLQVHVFLILLGYTDLTTCVSISTRSIIVIGTRMQQSLACLPACLPTTGLLAGAVMFCGY